MRTTTFVAARLPSLHWQDALTAKSYEPSPPIVWRHAQVGAALTRDWFDGMFWTCTGADLANEPTPSERRGAGVKQSELSSGDIFPLEKAVELDL